MINIKAVLKAYLTEKKKEKEGASPVLLSQRRAEAFCEDYNLTDRETANFLDTISALSEAGEELELSLSSLDVDYRGANAVSFPALRSALHDVGFKPRREGQVFVSPLYATLRVFLEDEKAEQGILIASLLLQEEEATWEEVYTAQHEALTAWKTDSFIFSYMFVAVAERVAGKKLNTEQELLSLTGYSRYLEEEPKLEELVDAGGLLHTASLYKYRRAIERKMRRGATYKQLLAIKPSSFGLPSDLSKVDSIYNGSFYSEDEEKIVKVEAYAWESKEAIVGALINDKLLGGDTWDKKNRGYLVELYSKALVLSFEELLSIQQTADRF